jgi:hypothetical protein|tara:strand:- start:308 stop:520 length:213 start_codon:yes stop_codon:yes gene_type:complete
MKKMTQPQLARLLNTSDPKLQHEMLMQIGANPIVDPRTAKLIIYDTAIEKAMSRPTNQRPFEMNLDAIRG